MIRTILITIALTTILFLLSNAHAQPEVWFDQQNLVTGFRGAVSFVPIDLDGDEDYDLVACAHNDNDVGWFENIGAFVYTWHPIDQNIAYAYSVDVGDLDADDDLDIVAVGIDEGEVRIYWNDGDLNFENTTLAEFNWAHSVLLSDIDEDSDLDIFATGWGDGEVGMWINDGSGQFTQNIISDGSNRCPCVSTPDMDDDGDLDVFFIEYNSGHFKWLENDGEENFTLHQLDAHLSGLHHAVVVDLDDDGDLDIAAVGYLAGDLIWLENDGTMSFTTHMIQDNFTGAIWVDAADINQDGVIDLVGASEDGQNEIAWWENDGSQQFIKHSVITAFHGATNVLPFDLDEDGDLDLIGAACRANRITWFIHSLNTMPPQDFQITLPEENANLPLEEDFRVEWQESEDPDEGGDVHYTIYFNTTYDGAEMPTRRIPYTTDPFYETSIAALWNFSESDTHLVRIHVDAISQRDTTTCPVRNVLFLPQNSAPEPSSGQPVTAHIFHEVYPNPFNSTAHVRFELAAPASPVIRIYNVLGESVHIIEPGVLPSGMHTIPFSGESLTSGTYFVEIEFARNQTQVQRVLYVR